MISVCEFERKILEREEIVVRVRAPVGTQVHDYVFDRKAEDNQTVSEWLKKRVKPLLSGLEVAVISGNYTTPHGRTYLETLRDSYK